MKISIVLATRPEIIEFSPTIREFARLGSKLASKISGNFGVSDRGSAAIFRGSKRLMQKPIRVSGHARERIVKYGLDEELVIRALRDPDRLVAGYHGRKVAHKLMNERIIRVIYEEDDVIKVVTVYPSRRERYEETVQESRVQFGCGRFSDYHQQRKA